MVGLPAATTFLWASIHALQNNKPAEYAERQGPAAVKQYNDEIENLLAYLSPEKRPPVLDWFPITMGTKSWVGNVYVL